MKAPDLHQWRPLTPDGSVLWLKYSFGPGTANALAAILSDGTWLVISPPSHAPPTVYEGLERRGRVGALVAPNSFHNMGQAAWRQRFPDAISYAPQGALARLGKKTPGIEYRAIEELEPRLRPGRAFLPNGMKSPDLMFGFPTAAGPIWWMGDQFSNNGIADQILPLRLLSGFVGSGLGFRGNSKPELVYVGDRTAWLDSIRLMMDEMPPAIVVPAHGDPVTEQAVERTRRAAAAIDPRLAQQRSFSARAAYLLVGVVLGAAAGIRRLLGSSGAGRPGGSGPG